MDEMRTLLGQMQIDIYVLRRELQKAEEVNAALYLELHPEPVEEEPADG